MAATSRSTATRGRGSSATPRPAESVGPARGASIGRYLVLAHAGQGGMGTVYVAYDPELDRKVALKLWRDDGSDPEEGARRILREARALARLSHPHVVPVYDVGEHSGGVYMAMELVEGLTLREFLSRPRPWREVLRVMIAAGRGLEAAHAAGVIHRDFKPDNVMLGADGRVRVVDFGLARPGGDPAARAAVPGLSMVVTHGTQLGTPAYMAPEQHDGAPLDARADQFAFCVTLYEALYGVRPFAGDSPRTQREAIARGQLQRSPHARLPKTLPRIIERGLAEDPPARHASMTALLRKLEALRRRRGRRLRLLGLGVALSLSSALTWALVSPAPPAEADQVQRLARQARDAAAKVLFVYPPPDDPTQPTAYTRVRQLEALGLDDAQESADTLRQEFAATLCRVGDEYWEREGGTAFAMDYYAQALVFVPDQAHARARTSLTQGELASLRDKAEDQGFSPAELDAGALLAALALPDPQQRDEAVTRLRARTRGRALSTQITLEALAHDPTRATRPEGERPAATTDPTPDPTPPDPAEDEPEAEPGPETEGQAGEARGDDTPARPRRNPAAAAELVKAASAAMKRRKFEEAKTLLHRAIAADPRSADAAARLSDLEFDRGHYDEAARWAGRAVKLAPRVAAHHMRRGDALFKVLRYAEARQAYAAAQALGAKAAARRLRQIDEKIGAP